MDHALPPHPAGFGLLVSVEPAYLPSVLRHLASASIALAEGCLPSYVLFLDLVGADLSYFVMIQHQCCGDLGDSPVAPPVFSITKELHLGIYVFLNRLCYMLEL